MKKMKCLFDCLEVAYLGHVILATGVTMDDQKVRAVVDWPVPRSVRVVHAFLGLASYYHRFIRDYDTIAMLLTALLRKDGFRSSAEAFWAL
jgi:cytochrome b subunit of formate dehydrogenase